MLESAIIFLSLFLFVFLVLYIKRQNDIESNFNEIKKLFENHKYSIDSIISILQIANFTKDELEKIESVSYAIWENDDYSLVYDKDKSFYWNYLVLVNLVNILRKKVK